ncbi:MAG: hypothetical protein JRN24_03575, partial [Nitrososphaerota archaeon]|nr:hypothetical protein [Nitrososphaerota archaeon]
RERRDRRLPEMEETTTNEGDQPVSTNECQDCGQSYKTPQGLAGHRRLKHSASTARELEERKRSAEQKEAELRARQEATERRAAEAARVAEATKRREAEIARRQRELAAAEAIPKSERLRKAVEEEIVSLPEVTEETILRVRGADYRIEDGRLRHLYWPKGEKTEFEEGERFQFDGRAYCIRDGRLQAVRSSAILASLLQEEE